MLPLLVLALKEANRYPFNFRQTHKSIFFPPLLILNWLCLFVMQCWRLETTIEHAFFHPFLVICLCFGCRSEGQIGYKFRSCTHDLTLVHKSQVYRIGWMVSTTMHCKTILMCFIDATNQWLGWRAKAMKQSWKICLVDFQNGKINGKMIRMLDMINIFIFTLFYCLIWPLPSLVCSYLTPHAYTHVCWCVCVCPESENCFHLFS